jgi:Helix-hairpin-helix motif
MPELLDINTARTRQVAALPGIGHLLARRIVLDRRLFGPFRRLADLTRIDGLTPGLLGVLEHYVSISPAQYIAPEGRLVFENGSEPVVFVGPPDGLEGGSFWARNEGDGPLLLRSLDVEDSTLRTPRGEPLKRVVVGARLYPGESKEIQLRVHLDPTTAPGKYPAQFVAGDQRQSATFLVTEYLSTGLSPSTITLPAGGGTSEHPVLVHNGGNLPLTIGDFGALVLEDPEVECRTIRETLHHAPPMPTLDKLVGTASDQLKKNYTELPPLKVRTKNKPVHVAPGEDALLVLEVHVPHKLPRRRNFVARATVYDAALVFHLLSWLQPVDEV